jgi:hypothetical protein
MAEWKAREIVNKAEHREVWEGLMRAGMCEGHCSAAAVEEAIEIARGRDRLDVVNALRLSVRNLCLDARRFTNSLAMMTEP